MLKKINPAWLFMLSTLAILPCFNINSNMGFIFNAIGIGMGYLPQNYSSLISISNFIYLFAMICFIILLFKDKYDANMLMTVALISTLKILFSIAFALWCLSISSKLEIYKIGIPNMVFCILCYVFLIIFNVVSVIPKFEKVKNVCKKIWYIPAIFNLVRYVFSLLIAVSLEIGLPRRVEFKRMIYRIIYSFKFEYSGLLCMAIIVSLIDVAAMLIFSYKLVNCRYPAKKESLKMNDLTTVKNTEMPNIESLSDAILKAIKPTLKAPLTAVLCDASEFVIIDMNNNTYSVEGYVNSQNSYGAMISTDFTVKVQYQSNMWVVKKTTVGVKNAKKYATNFAINYIAISIFVAIMTVIGFFLLKTFVGM